MTDDESASVQPPQNPDASKSWAGRHPRFMILLTAAVFYVILIGMCGFVIFLLLRG